MYFTKHNAGSKILNEINLSRSNLEEEKETISDLIENHLGYESGNLRWVTREINVRNRRNTHNHASDPINKKKTPTYLAWRSLIKKHGDEVCIGWKSDGNCETSNGFKNFLSDMGEKPPLDGRRTAPLMRYDETKPWCRENCYWS